MINVRVAIYIRVSTEEQAKEGYSIGAQEDRLRAYCISQDWEIFDVYKDEGRSAKDLERKELQRLLKDIKSGLIDVVLVYKLDRLTRSVLDLYKLLEEFDKYDVKFKSATEIYDTTTATGRLFITLVAALAQWERENLAERVKMGMLRKANLGEWLGGTSPYGAEFRDGRFHHIEHEKKIVQKMFKMIRTMGSDRVARILNSQGYRTRKGAEWAGYTVHYIVTNPFYIAKLRFNNERFQLRKPLREQQLFDTDLVEPMVDEQEFWEVQEILERRSGRKGRGMTGRYYFTSILKCGKCGAPMQGTVYYYKKSKRSVKFYRCSSKANGRSCKMPSIQENRLADEVLNSFHKLVFGWIQPKNVIQKDEAQAKDEWEQELKNVQRTMEKYKMMFVNDLIDFDELNEKMHVLREKEKELKYNLSNDHSSPTSSYTLEELEMLVQDFPGLWEVSTDEERKILLSEIFREIVVDADENAKVSPGNSKPFWIVSAK